MSGTDNREKNVWMISREMFGKQIVARILMLDEGIHISVYGGERTHIGAVTMISPDGKISTTQFPGHKDAEISTVWAKRFYEIFQVPVLCGAGIHYDNLRLCEILEIVERTEHMMEEVIAIIQKETA